MLISFVSSEVYACPTIRGFPTSLQNHLVYQPVRLNGNIGIEPLENQRITGWSVDWGDGSKVTKGTGLVVDVTKKDGYSKVGDYTIVITVNWEYYDKRAKVWKPGDPNAVIGNRSTSIKIEAELKAITAEKLKAGVKEKVKLEVQTLGYDEKTGGADKPVKDIVINFAITSDPSSKATLSKTSDITKGNGKASTEITLGDKVGDYVVRASGEYLRGSPIDFTIKAEFGTFAGTVYEVKDKKRIGVLEHVVISGESIKPRGYAVPLTQTNFEGKYTVEVIPATYNLFAYLTGYSEGIMKNVSVSAFATTAVDFELHILRPYPKGQRDL